MWFLFIAAIATAFNFLIVIWKYTNHRYLDATLDLGTFALIAILAGGSVAGLQIGMLASAIVSVYLLVNPPKIKLTFLEDLI